jgi:hypothetical protein
LYRPAIGQGTGDGGFTVKKKENFVLTLIEGR